MRGGPGCCWTGRAFSLRLNNLVPAGGPHQEATALQPSISALSLTAHVSQQKPSLQAQCHRFKCYLYADTSQIYASRLDLSPGLQTCSSCCLFGISTGVFNSCLKLQHSQNLALPASQQRDGCSVCHLSCCSAHRTAVSPQTMSHLRRLPFCPDPYPIRQLPLALTSETNGEFSQYPFYNCSMPNISPSGVHSSFLPDPVTLSQSVLTGQHQ